MRNAWRVLAFDIAAPLAAIAALLAIGYVLNWPAWWVSACSVLTLLIVPATFSIAVGIERWAGPRLGRRLLTFRPGDDGAEVVGIAGPNAPALGPASPKIGFRDGDGGTQPAE